MAGSSFSPSAWSISHPIGVIMLTLGAVVLGFVAFSQLRIDLLPHLIYPEVRVRVIDPGVPATIMEDQITRQLEEQLAITEDAVNIQSTTTEGRSSVDLTFPYGKDIDMALRDASIRLDRAKRFLPDSIDPPVIFKRDPFQLPIMEILVSSTWRSPVELREWSDYELAPWLTNLPGVAAAEIGGGLQREIHIIADPNKLQSMRLDVVKLADQIARANQDTAAGRLLTQQEEISGRTLGRLTSINDIGQIKLTTADTTSAFHLNDIASVISAAEEQRIIIRNDGRTGVKVSIQKQPGANTIEVVDAVSAMLAELARQELIPDDISVNTISDQAGPIRAAINNAASAAIGGAFLAMLVVYLFLGNLRRTLIIGTAIPVATLITFGLMALAGLNINIMTLGGLALGIGMLVDNTIVMLENMHRHQKMQSTPERAVGEVTSAIIASTSTNLAAVMPFLFLTGLIGLIFRELIFTISAAIFASMIVALTLVPALTAHFSGDTSSRALVEKPLAWLTLHYRQLLALVLAQPAKIKLIAIALLTILLILMMRPFAALPSDLLPRMDEGLIQISLTADRGTTLVESERLTNEIEAIIATMPGVESVFTTIGGFVFGRSSFERSNRASLQIQLVPSGQRSLSAQQWIEEFDRKATEARIPGLQIRAFVRAISGLRVNQGEDDLSLKVRGTNLETLNQLADQIVAQLKPMQGIRNTRHAAEETIREMLIEINHDKAASAGLTSSDIGDAVRIALEGKVISTFYDDDRSIDIILRMDKQQWRSPSDISNVQLVSTTQQDSTVRLGDVATVRIQPAQASITRDRQQRVVEINASLTGTVPLQQVVTNALEIVAAIDFPEGYTVSESGSLMALQEGQSLGTVLLALALFLVLMVMAVQYESLRNPLVIMFGVPFAGIGVAIGLWLWNISISMPVWIGLIMLAGIVVNNAIVLLTTVENLRQAGMERTAAIIEAAGLRLKPILMATFTTVFGMLPLALAFGSGSEMLKPLAVVLVSGLLFSMLISLVLIPVIYKQIGNP